MLTVVKEARKTIQQSRFQPSPAWVSFSVHRLYQSQNRKNGMVVAMREINRETRSWNIKVEKLCAAAPRQQPKQPGEGVRDAWGWWLSRCEVITGLKRERKKRRTWTPGLTECNGRKEGRWVVHVWQWQQRHSSRGTPWVAGGPRRQEQRHFYKKENWGREKEQIKSSLSALTYKKQIIREKGCENCKNAYAVWIRQA